MEIHTHTPTYICMWKHRFGYQANLPYALKASSRVERSLHNLKASNYPNVVINLNICS